MTTFDDRERAFETKFAHDEEMRFRLIARRNKLLGMWAAKQMNLSQAEYGKVLDQVRSLELGAMRQLDAANQEGLSLIELCIDPDEGPEARLERSELRQHLAGFYSIQCKWFFA